MKLRDRESFCDFLTSLHGHEPNTGYQRNRSCVSWFRLSPPASKNYLTPNLSLGCFLKVGFRKGLTTLTVFFLNNNVASLGLSLMWGEETGKGRGIWERAFVLSLWLIFNSVFAQLIWKNTNLCASILTDRFTFEGVAQLLFDLVPGKTCYFLQWREWSGASVLLCWSTGWQPSNALGFPSRFWCN